MGFHNNHSLNVQFAFHEIFKSFHFSKHNERNALFGAPHHFWSPTNGSLNKLQFYLSNIALKDERAEQLQAKLSLLNEKSSPSEIERVLRSLSSFLLMKLPFLFDENLLFFLLKSKKSFRALHGKEMVEKKLKELFFTTRAAKEWIRVAYAERGFDRIVL